MPTLAQTAKSAPSITSKLPIYKMRKSNMSCYWLTFVAMPLARQKGVMAAKFTTLMQLADWTSLSSNQQASPTYMKLCVTPESTNVRIGSSFNSHAMNNILRNYIVLRFGTSSMKGGGCS